MCLCRVLFKKTSSILKVTPPFCCTIEKFIQAASVAETDILASEIKSNQYFIDQLKENVSMSNPNLLEEENEGEIRNF